MTDLLEALRSGAVRLVPVEPTDEMIRAAWRVTEVVPADERMGVLLSSARTAHSVKMLRRWKAMLSASPDHTAAVVAMIEEREEKLEYWPETSKHWEARALAAEAERDALRTELETARAEIETVRQSREYWRGATDEWQAHADTLRAERDGLRADVARALALSALGGNADGV